MGNESGQNDQYAARSGPSAKPSAERTSLCLSGTCSNFVWLMSELCNYDSVSDDASSDLLYSSPKLHC